MKITLNQDPAFEETEVIINCPQADEDVLRLVAMLRVYQKKLVGMRGGERHLLDVKDILYIDTTDKKTFLYTEKTVFESALRLYELVCEVKVKICVQQRPYGKEVRGFVHGCGLLSCRSSNPFFNRMSFVSSNDLPCLMQFRISKSRLFLEYKSG